MGIFLAIATVIASVLAGVIQHARNADKFEARFAALTTEFTDLIAARFSLYQYALRGARGAIIAGGRRQISRAQFEDYVGSREHLSEFPGSRGIGYIARVPADESDSFVAAARGDGFPSFAIRELAPNSAERFIIQYIYPLKGNEGATGLDIASERNRRNAALAAAKSGKPTLTAPITLVQASGQTNHGFLILLPVYPREADLSLAEERQNTAIGWSYSPLVVSEMLKDLGHRREEISFSLTDIHAGIQFYQSPGFTDDVDATISQTEIFGRAWSIKFHALPAFGARIAEIKPWALSALIGIAGLLLAAAGTGLALDRQKRRENRIEEERFAYKLLDTAPQALLVVEENGQIQRANTYAGIVFSYTAGELVGMSVDELLPANIRSGHADLRASYDYRERGMGEQRELFALRADGSEFPVLVRLAPLEIGDRKLVIAGVTDITLEREAFAVVTSSQQRWQEMANSIPQLIWTCNAAGECDFLSQQWAEYTGLPLEPQLGSGWLEQVHTADRGVLMKEWTKSIDTSSPFKVEFRIRRYDGEYRLFFVQAEPIFGNDGKVVRWIGANTDIEDRYQAEMQVRGLLKDMEKRVAERTAELDTAMRDLRNIVDAIPSMISYWDKNQINRFANNAYEHWFGVTPDWLAGRHLKKLLGNVLYEKSRPHIEGVLKGNVQVFERDLTDIAGIKHATQATYLPDIVDGDVIGFYTFIFDVSQLKAAEVAQKEAREAAEAATLAKSVFLTSMSHELRTPMNSILGFSDLMLTENFGPLNEKQAEYSRYIKQSGEHLMNLMDGVLELSKIESGQIPISIEPVNVISVVKSVISTLQPLAEKFSITIRDQHIGSADEYIAADMTRITQVLINLGSNAIKYNDTGGWIAFECIAVSDEFYRISVTDNGRGIPSDRYDDVFKPFNRLGAENGAVEGTGIGLSLVKNYVELMDGKIGFESAEGEGSTFWFEMPRVMPDENTVQEAVGADQDKDLLTINDAMKVLYVEDNEINRMLFKHYMSMIENIEYIEAVDGTSGLKMVRETRPDIIFLDINLPDMSGYDVLKEIKSDQALSSVPVVALTAKAMSGDAEYGLNMGFTKYLAKPARLQDIVQVFQDLNLKTK